MVIVYNNNNLFCGRTFIKLELTYTLCWTVKFTLVYVHIKNYFLYSNNKNLLTKVVGIAVIKYLMVGFEGGGVMLKNR